MDLKKQLKNIVLSLHKIVQGQNGVYVKRYSLVKSEFGINIQLHIFKNCSGVSLLNILRFSQQVLIQFEKDLQKNQFVDIEKVIIPQVNDIMIYGGKNQAYIGFSTVVYCSDLNNAIKIFENIGYTKFLKEENNVTRNKFI